MEIVTSEFWRFDFQNHLWSKNLTGSSKILLDIYGMERGTQYRNKTFRKPWSGHRITYSSSSTCCGLGILYPSWSKLKNLPAIHSWIWRTPWKGESDQLLQHFINWHEFSQNLLLSLLLFLLKMEETNCKPRFRRPTFHEPNLIRIKADPNYLDRLNWFRHRP